MKRSGRLRRLAPAIGLVFLSPWVGEFLLGSSPIQHLPAALVLLVPLYGGGALLIREIARRFGLGYPGVVLLGAAYGVIEAGLLDQSMFNPAFLNEGSDAGFATMANQALGYVAGHAVWSIGVPIAIAELLASGRSAAPWLGRTGLAAAAVLYGAGCAIVFSFIYAEYRFLASPVQLAGAAAGAALCVMAAFALRAGSGASSAGVSGGGASGDGDSGGVSGSGAPGASGEPEIAAVAAGSGGRIAGNSGGVRPWLAGAAAFAASGAFVARPEHGWIGLVSGLLLPAAAWYVVRRWSGSPWWSVRHRTALVSGALLTYAWLGFYVTWLIRPGDRIAWFGNVLFALTAIALALIMARRARAQAVHRESSSSRISMNGSGSSSGSPSPFSRYSS